MSLKVSLTRIKSPKVQGAKIDQLRMYWVLQLQLIPPSTGNPDIQGILTGRVETTP